ncbi:MAG: hypothetical protein J6F30_00525 [Cellulosilyticum sp.]|nr:hypothetical protein [Cellulosilyticum sp.]
MNHELKEIEEAILAGQSALQALDEVEKSLSSASSWGLWDLFGGGFLSSIMKHSRIDEAQNKMEYATRQIERFNKEIGEVQSFKGIQISFDGVIKGMDYFLDNFIVDFMVQQQVNKRKEQVIELKREIQSAVNQLHDAKNSYKGHVF